MLKNWEINEWGLFDGRVCLKFDESPYELISFKIIPREKARYVQVGNRIEPREIIEINDEPTMGIPINDVIIFEFARELPDPIKSKVFYQEIDEALKPLVEFLRARPEFKGFKRGDFR